MLALALALAVPSADPAPFDVGQAMHGVVVLVTDLGGGVASYGSGIVVDDRGDVLTNLHVLDGAKGVRALVYDPEKPSYAAVDGGLPRLVFERDKDLIPVRIVRGDPVLDLALVHLERPARVLVMPLATQPLAAGEPVAALGHPEQNFWTITRGQVSGLHEGLIQHDAAINKGNSGGPLLNQRGEVVGINTLFLKGAQGISYARPIALAHKLLDSIKGPVALDRSSPQRSIESCNRALELGDPSYSQCINWGSDYAAFRDMVQGWLDSDDAAARLAADLLGEGQQDAELVRRIHGGPKAHARKVVREWLEHGDGRAEVWVNQFGPLALAFALDDDPVEVGKRLDAFMEYAQGATRGGRPPKTLPARASHEKPPERPKLADGGLTIDVNALQPGGLKVEYSDIAAIRKTMKMGLRVESVAMDGDEHAWASLTGLNLDGTPYHYSVALVRGPDRLWTSVPWLTDGTRKEHPKPKDYPPRFEPTQMVLVIALVMAALPVGLYVVTDEPDGISIDLDFEHSWPTFLESVRRQSTANGKKVAASLEAAFAGP